MKRENLVFLAGGFAFGILFGFAVYRGVMEPPGDPAGRAAATSGSSVPSPAGPMAPTQEGSRLPPALMEELQTLKRKLEQDPNDLAALVRAGDMLFRMGAWEEALRFYDRGLEVNASDPDLLTVTGLCYREMGRFDEALERFESAHRLEPTHWQSLYNIVVVNALDLGRTDRAQEALDELEAADLPDGRLAELRDAIENAREKESPQPP